jgi:UDP-glucose 4-epimerase
MSPSFTGARCVVTGGLGFIGSNVALALAEAGARVTVVDALVPGHGGDEANVAGAGLRVVVADVGDAERVAPVVADADFVFDVAGQVSHLAAAQDPERDLALNAAARLRLVEILRRVNPTVTAVYTSTRQVYGRAERLPVTEDLTPRPIDANGISKLAGEHFHLLRNEDGAGRTAVVRLSNVYGPRQHLLRDDLGVLPVFARRALRAEPLVVFGDGRDERDPLHVDDVVEAILAAAVTPEAAGIVINIGGPEPLSLRRLAELTSAASAARPPVVPGDWPAANALIDVGSVHMSSARASEVLGWEPRIRFEEGIRRTLEWFAQHPERYR